MMITHGTLGLAVGYLAAVAGLVAGLILRRAPRWRWLVAPALAIPIALAAGMVWSVLLDVVPGLRLRLGPAGAAVGGAACVLLVGVVLGGLAPRRPPGPKVTRGTRVRDADSGGGAGRGGMEHLRFAGQPLAAQDETKHFKLIGTTGTGKSTAIRALLRGALARGDRAVIADPDGGYAAEFYRPERGDLILNPFDVRSCRWDLFGEMNGPQDPDLLARALIPEQGGDDRTWRAYARVFLSALLRQLARAHCDELSDLHRLVTTAEVEELRELLAGTPAAPYMSDENARFFSSVRAVAAAQLAALEHLALPLDAQPLSVRRWIRADPGDTAGAVLFLPYRASQIAALRGVVSTWMRLAIFEAMELSEADHRLWFIIDELDALGPIDGLKDALARLRKFGGRCILGFQSIAQVSGTYGVSDAQTIVENCGNTLILRCSAAENGGTARFASKLIGEREIIRRQESRSDNGPFGGAKRSRSVSLQHVLESAVLPAEIEQLPDLHGYLKVASATEWLRLQVRR
jgi:type IV secretory pathway TraG/TraD family ATPase VirD4